MTPEQMQADIDFLLLRADCAGSCSFSNERWTGMSSNAIVSVAYGGKQTAMPSDRSDYAACVRTVRRLPKHRRTEKVLKALQKARVAYLKNYPDDAYSLVRRAKRQEWERQAEARRERERKSFQRRMKRKYGS